MRLCVWSIIFIKDFGHHSTAINYRRRITINPLAELSQCILDSSNGSIINVI